MVETGRIVDNTIVLYMRTILIIILSLFSSRVVLDALGITNWGIYSVVGGFVGMFSFMNTSMTVATQRFLTFELGKKNGESIKKVFSLSICIHLIIAIVTFLLLESFGIYYIDHKLNIPLDRMSAAVVCFHLSALTLLFEIIKVPFTATIIAYEKMSTFAYLDILFNIGKLLISLGLYYVLNDQLMIYSSSLCCLTFVLLIVYIIYCRRKFNSCRFIFIWDGNLFGKMLSFAGWISFSAISLALRDQGINLLFNLFIGVWINAAYSVAQQVHSTVYKLINNLQVAFSPQITKTIAADNREDSKKIVQSGTKFSVLLFAMFLIPIVFKIKYVLSLWLVEVPHHSEDIIKLLLINSLCILYASSSITAVRAYGKIARYEIIVNTINVLCFVITYFAMSLYKDYRIALLLLVLSSFSQMMVIVKISSKILNTKYIKFLYNVVLKSSYAILPTYFIVMAVNSMLNESFISLLVVGFTSTFLLSITGYFFYLDKSEKIKLKSIIKNGKERIIKKTNS